MKTIYALELLEEAKTKTHYILRVPGGWIFTDRRGDNAVGTFVPFRTISNDVLPNHNLPVLELVTWNEHD